MRNPGYTINHIAQHYRLLMMNLKLLLQISGWLGAGFYLVAYFLLMQEKLKSTSYTYCIMNLMGSIFLIISLAPSNLYGPLFLNTCWGLIGLHSLSKIYFSSRKD